MLVLGRKKSESVTLFVPGHEPITVMVCDVWDGQIRLGFTCPDDVKILRTELLTEKNDELP